MAAELPNSPEEMLGALSRLEQAVTSIAGVVAAIVGVKEGLGVILKDKYKQEGREEGREEAREEFLEWQKKELAAGVEFKNGPPDFVNEDS